MSEVKCEFCSAKSKERSEKEYKDLLNRLSRIEGQVRGVKAMVERNDGTITVASQDSIGTTFTVTFPTFDMEVDSQ